MKFLKTFLFSTVAFFFVLGVFQSTQGTKDEFKLISYPEMKEIMETNKEHRMELYKTLDGQLRLSVNKEHYKANIDPTSSVDDLIKDYKVLYDSEQESNAGSTFWNITKWVLILFVVFIIIGMIRGKNGAGGGAGGLMNFGKMSQKVKREVPNTTMKDVGGLTPETKDEINWAIKMFKEMDKAIAMGVPPTKAMLYYGPPGTGKTTIAKAMAGEMGATFYQTSGSEFVEMFVGVGASRVRDIFEDAKKNAPSIIFVDEFDAIGGKREAGGAGGGGREAEQTLNQLLVELSELKAEDRVFVVAATNFVEKLDPALIRPGRFDYKIKIDLPDLEGRREIIAIHSKGKNLSEDVVMNMEMLAKSMYGYSGADIEDVFKQAARKAFFSGKTQIGMKEISYAIDRALLGSEGRPHAKEDIKKRIAYHEAGHALIQVLNKRGSVRKATITPRGNAGGVVIMVPDDNSLSTRSELVGRISVSVAGGVAERLIFNEHSVGVSGDLEQVKRLIESMVNKVGMASDDMKLFFDEKEKKKEMENIFNEAVRDCRRLIGEHKHSFENLAKALIERETLSGDEIEEIVYGQEKKVTLELASNE